MSNQLAIFLGIVILGFLGWDQFYNEGIATLFLARKFAELVEWMAFWR